MNLLHALGMTGERAVIVHHDDLGVLHATNEAHRSLPDFPTGSVIVPAPWATEWAGTPGVDLGVHLTLTSEWRWPRWRPLTGGASLRDPQGCFWPTVEQAWSHIRADEAEVELRAQIDTALAWGIDVTHIDTHMGAVLRPDLAEIYHRLAFEYRLAIFLPDTTVLEQLLAPNPVPDELRALLTTSSLPKLKAVDFYGAPPAARPTLDRERYASLPPGVYHVIHHASLPTDEGRAFPDWRVRAADYEALHDAGVRAALAGCETITYRTLRDWLRRTVL
jgi:hypothetical protein